MKILRMLWVALIMMGCNSVRHLDGWYPVADYPEDKIEGKAIVTAKDFASVALDTAYRPDMPVIVCRVKDEKIPEWSAATGSRIGKRIGFVYRDSVIMAPTVNCRLESGTFTIECQDSVLIRKIYNSLSDVSKVCVDSMNEEGTEHMNYGSVLRKKETKVVKICMSR